MKLENLAGLTDESVSCFVEDTHGNLFFGGKIGTLKRECENWDVIKHAEVSGISTTVNGTLVIFIVL